MRGCTGSLRSGALPGSTPVSPTPSCGALSVGQPDPPGSPHRPSLQRGRGRPPQPPNPARPGPFSRLPPPPVSVPILGPRHPLGQSPRRTSRPHPPLLHPAVTLRQSPSGSRSPVRGAAPPLPAAPLAQRAPRRPTAPNRQYHCSASRGNLVTPAPTPTLTKRVVPKRSQHILVNLHPRRRRLLIGSQEPRPERHFRRKEAREVRLESLCLPQGVLPGQGPRPRPAVSGCGERVGEGEAPKLLTNPLTSL